jgi:hypothetical protein
MSRFLTTIILRGLATAAPQTFGGWRIAVQTLQPVRVATEPNAAARYGTAAGARGRQVPAIRALPIQEPPLSLGDASKHLETSGALLCPRGGAAVRTGISNVMRPKFHMLHADGDSAEGFAVPRTWRRSETGVLTS